MKKFLIIIAIAAAVIAGGALLKNNSKSSKSDSAGAVQPTNHTYGNGSTGVVVKEYADFQCPGCAAFYTILKDVKEKKLAQQNFNDIFQ